MYLHDSEGHPRASKQSIRWGHKAYTVHDCTEWICENMPGACFNLACLFSADSHKRLLTLALGVFVHVGTRHKSNTHIWSLATVAFHWLFVYFLVVEFLSLIVIRRGIFFYFPVWGCCCGFSLLGFRAFVLICLLADLNSKMLQIPCK